MKTTKLLLLSGMFVSLGMLASCADDDLANGGGKNGGDKGTAVTFNVSDAQEDAQKAMVMTVAGNTRAFAGAVSRVGFEGGLAIQGLTPEDLTSQKLAVQGGNAGTCLIETTTAGVNPPPAQVTDAPQTRANITKINELGHFSTIGFRGTSSGSINTPWFHNQDTNPNGTLVTPIQWSWGQPYGKFFAVSPREVSYAKLTLSPDGTAAPYVDFEVEPKVTDQRDLMTACSGEVHYAVRFVAPETNLRFHHALTAVRFKVGQNLSWNKTITKVEIVGAKSKGRYTLSADATGAGAAWSNLSSPATFTLGGDGSVNVSTAEAVNNIIVGKPGDNFTFYMIPQPLTGNSVQVKVTLNDGKVLTSTLSGTWKPGTTKTYALTEDQSKWNYVLTVVQSNNNKLQYTDTDAGTYTVQSYRNDNSVSPLVQQPVKWKVVSYQESKDGGATWEAETTVKPAWLSLGKTEGDGSILAAGETGSATVTKDINDKLAEYNKVLHDAAQKGSSGSPYDLSMHNFKGEYKTMNTANSYLISAPGWYKIPLVYGNAVTNGVSNEHAYKTAVSGSYVLQNFKDHAGADITSPYINVQNGSDPATQAAIVWTDQSGIVDGLSVTNSGANSYVNFHVPQDKIKNGNAVIAVKNASGTVMWSWHLWFDHSDVLNTVACTNYQGKVYNFTKQTLGFAYRKWENTLYEKPRVARVKVEQTVANGGVKKFATFTITQNNGNVRQGYSTLYQFGRKDALPGTDDILEGTFTKNDSDNMSIQNSIQHPETFYTLGSSWWYSGYNQYNVWSMDNTVTGFNDNAVVKTVYDPCPAGFHMPASNAFTGFTKNGKNGGSINASGIWDYGWNFNNKISSPDATVYFPASGFRFSNDGSLGIVGYYGFYWSAGPNGPNGGCGLLFYPGNMTPQGAYERAGGRSVRPVAE